MANRSANNVLKTMSINGKPCSYVTGGEDYRGYITDESRLSAPMVEKIFFPADVHQLSAALKQVRLNGERCVFSGGRTGVTGASVPLGAQAVISLERMNALVDFRCENDTYYMRCQPGMSLRVIDEIFSKRVLPEINELAKAYNAGDIPQLWFPVNPTESSAHIGGVVANNASGARSYGYGSTREWVYGLSIILSDGEQLDIKRGEKFCDHNRFSLRRSDGMTFHLSFPEFQYPQTKCTCGYYLQKDMDLIDLFIGSEGTLGAVAEVELRLTVKPQKSCGVMVFLLAEKEAADLVLELDRLGCCVAIEYFDSDSLRLVNQDCPGEYNFGVDDACAVYLEFMGAPKETKGYLQKLREILRGRAVVGTWAAYNRREYNLQSQFRHAVPEAVNALIGQRKKNNESLHKVGTDMAVPIDNLHHIMDYYRSTLRDSGLESVIFGHIGDGHLHVNILPRNEKDLVLAKELYSLWAKDVARIGGSVAAEHGIGRIKKNMLEIQYSPEVLIAMRKIRSAFDSDETLAPGVLISPV